MSITPHRLLHWNVNCDLCRRQRALVPANYVAESTDWLRKQARLQGWSWRDGQDLCPECANPAKGAD